MFAVVWWVPHLHLPLRAIAPFGLAAAICRTSVAVALHYRGAAPIPVIGVSLAADAVLLAGLLDITGGPFNPFIVMYVPYVWLAAATLSSRWGIVVAGVPTFGADSPTH
ncbi:MAG: hypothetical protein M3545_10810 [Acidobacteriota bacterium]|nr:hypothetical protein [Acidobacteriota bacterium]